MIIAWAVITILYVLELIIIVLGEDKTNLIIKDRIKPEPAEKIESNKYKITNISWICWK